jgi:hypothetical protein
MEISASFRNAAMTTLARENFLVRHDLNTLSTLLLLLYAISHLEGPERVWTLLGTALNMGIALKCHMNHQVTDNTEKERRRRLWAGILLLHTYQAILFRDVDLSFLLNVQATMPMEVNDSNLQNGSVQLEIGQITDMSLVKFKVRMFRLSSEICSHLSRHSQYDETTLRRFHEAIQREQNDWDSAFLIDGMPSVLDTASYAHWTILQTYAHQLYLLLHRPFHHSQSGQFRVESRMTCIESSAAFLDLYRQFCELPRLRYYRWIANGMTSFNALHGAVALTSCLLDATDLPGRSNYIDAIDSTAARMEKLQKTSPVCAKAYPILRRLQ